MYWSHAWNAARMNVFLFFFSALSPVPGPGPQPGNPCQNGGQVNNERTACICVQGYTGTFCENGKRVCPVQLGLNFL